MFWGLFVVLLALWLLGLLSGYALGGYIHLLLIVAIALVIFNLVARRRVW
jgi:hypothetical protein